MSKESTQQQLEAMGVQPHWAEAAAVILQKEIEDPTRQRSQTEQQVITTAWKQYELRQLHNTGQESHS